MLFTVKTNESSKPIEINLDCTGSRILYATLSLIATDSKAPHTNRVFAAKLMKDLLNALEDIE